VAGTRTKSRDHRVDWIGNKNLAVGIWETKDSVVQVNVVAANSTAPAKLIALATVAVPAFVNLGH
jgi:hypothetical protein